jgi:enoyl-CoA hydratase
MDGVREVADAIAARSPIAVRGVKQTLLYARDHSVEDGLDYIATWNAGMMSQQDIMAAVSAGGVAPDFEN